MDPSSESFYDGDVLQKSFQLFLNRSDEIKEVPDHTKLTRAVQTVDVTNVLSDLNSLSLLSKEKSQIYIIGVGSGTGCCDLEMISQLRLKHPGVKVEVEVVEPSGREILILKGFSMLDHVNFTWNQMTSEKFEEQWRQRNSTTKADLIHMLHILYYVDECRSYHQLLPEPPREERKTADHTRAERQRFTSACQNGDRTTDDIKSLLDESGVPYQSYRLQSWTDVTECFTEGEENGELLLNFITVVEDFSKKAFPELRQEVLKFLRDPQHCVEKDGKILANSVFEALVLGASD
ncbi:histamine N-methyltransferase-like [Boleophthalmus pectinirostris]|uniref:histamine N-methyltransferase-like n=1 Tax=Boleophthalmus pectinirostris TaxID=150288 RepID=UPI002432DF43|nr:histamine N-methyltransferase-like [Boleophthalmus pectinirostris]